MRSPCPAIDTAPARTPHFRQTWSCYENGTNHSDAVITYTRKK